MRAFRFTSEACWSSSIAIRLATNAVVAGFVGVGKAAKVKSHPASSSTTHFDVRFCDARERTSLRSGKRLPFRQDETHERILPSLGVGYRDAVVDHRERHLAETARQGTARQRRH